MALLLSRSGPPDPDVVRGMLAAAPHRGARHEVGTLGQVAVGTCNDPDWVTATLARDGDRLAVFCGALDNMDDLRTELRRAGARDPSDGTPAAILLAACTAWGDEAAAARLRGSFAGAVTDGREVRCFRDQFGARPLFHHDGPDGFYAATEVKQVLAGAPLPREPDMEHLHGIVFGGLERSTAFRGVERIPKRSLAVASPDPGLSVRAYWDPADLIESENLGLEDAAEGARHALARAVRRTLTGRDIVLLSGGLDSPALAAFADEGGNGGGARALTAVYPDHPSVDEGEWTRTAADHLGVPLHEFVPDARSLDDVEDWVRLLDGPIDVLSIPEMAQSYRAARDLGARTVLTGEVAEMLFENRAYLLDHYLAHLRLRPLASYLAVLRSRGWTWRQLAYQFFRILAPTALMTAWVNRSPKRPRDLPGWIDYDRLMAARVGTPPWQLGRRQRWPEMQVSILKGPGIAFEASEICAAVCGVDSRRPFADVDLWEFVLSLPAEVKFPNHRTKPLLRRAMRGVLPDRLIDRKDKTLFNEYHLDRADYPKLRRLLVETPRYLEGIDYDRLREDLMAEDMNVMELQWARDVARVHAFLEQF